MAVAEFAQSLLAIPKTLAVNAAQDSTELVAKLRAFHNASQTMVERENLKWLVIILLPFYVIRIAVMTNFLLSLEVFVLVSLLFCTGSCCYFCT